MQTDRSLISFQSCSRGHRGGRMTVCKTARCHNQGSCVPPRVMVATSILYQHVGSRMQTVGSLISFQSCSRGCGGCHSCKESISVSTVFDKKASIRYPQQRFQYIMLFQSFDKLQSCVSVPRNRKAFLHYNRSTQRGLLAGSHARGV